MIEHQFPWIFDPLDDLRNTQGRGNALYLLFCYNIEIIVQREMAENTEECVERKAVV
jgi:hypothetical protein